MQFPAGIPGFPGVRRFALRALVTDSAFQLLESVDDDSVSMVVARPWLFFPNYAPDIDDEDQDELGLENAEDALVFCPVSIDRDAGQFHINLRGPFVVNIKTNEGRQVVLDESIPVRAVIEVSND